MITPQVGAGLSRFLCNAPPGAGYCCAPDPRSPACQAVPVWFSGGGSDAGSDSARGGAADTPSLKQPPGGGPARPRPRCALTGLAIAVVSAVAVVTAGCASSSASSPAHSSASSPAHSSASSPAAAQPASSSSGAIHFPSMLFGLPHNTGASAQQVARGVIHGLAVMPISPIRKSPF